MKNANSDLARIKSMNEIITFEEDPELKTDRSLKASKIKNDKDSKNNYSLILNDKSDIKIYSPDLPIQQINNKKSESENVKLKKISADNFEKFVNESGINSCFELIFSEIIYKKIPAEDHFSYAAGRLRQIGRELETIKNKIVNK